MNTFLKLLLSVILAMLIVYLLIPSPAFPEGLPKSPKSLEPGDSRDPEHFAGYFTNLTRHEVISYYQKQFQLPGFFRFVPSYRLNYPPEEAFTLIADQTRSSYLEEIVYPLRESLFINGYEPKDNEDKIAFENQPYSSKVTIRYYQSNPVTRLVIVSLCLTVIWWLFYEYKRQWQNLVHKQKIFHSDYLMTPLS